MSTPVSIHGFTDPSLVALQSHLTDAVRTAVLRVAAHDTNPEFLLPGDAASLEQLLMQRFRMLPQDKRSKAGALAAAELRRPGATGKFSALLPASTLAQLSPLNLPAPSASVLSALKTSPFSVAEVAAPSGSKHGSGHGPTSPAKTYKSLEFRLRAVQCADDTGELGLDEINVGGTATDASGIQKIFQDVGQFSKGQTKTFTSVLHSFSLGAGTWPRAYVVSVILAEIDWGNFPAWLDAIIKVIQVPLNAALTAWLKSKAGSGTADGGFDWRAAAVELAVLVLPLVTAALFSAIEAWFQDDIFTPQVAGVTLASASSDFDGSADSGELTVTCTYSEGWKGIYKVTYDWNLVS